MKVSKFFKKWSWKGFQPILLTLKWRLTDFCRLDLRLELSLSRPFIYKSRNSRLKCDFEKDFNLFYIPWSVGWWTFVDTGLSTWAKSVKTPEATEVTGSTASSRRAVVRRTDERHDPTVCLSKSWLAFGFGWLCLAGITMAGLSKFCPKIMNTFFVLKD